MFRRLITTTAALLATGLVLTGCGAANAGSTSTPDTSKPLRIMADVTPHSLLLKEAEKDIGAPAKITAFIRFALGEGIEKEEQDFAAEVAAAGGTTG